MPARSNKNAKRIHILDTALRVFAAKGFHAATTKEIAAEAGVAEGLLFYYFGGKRELMLQAVRRFSFLETLQDSAPQFETMDPQQALTAFGLMYVRFVDSHKDYLQLIWSHELSADEAVQREVTSLIAGMTEQGAKLLARAAPVTTHRAKLATAAAMLLSSLLAFAMLAERMGRARSEQSDRQYVGEVVEIALNGLSGT
ncbi:hypothetical protein SD70_31135 [Gordoniibacillus kamchatkensis]|uniref:HTH tetR-type domain-containing protein n=1 Tax=Gordoniibacillus kamchatkensis TaxID=1590651 RepID=A0ABR5A7P5_9BACL|nr:TetR family transcriptional regulator [Paenibacillus sp. VKM B-2647]KIL37076.1 hypothetical protein SD70_31135 [Paenibacillus sp. VKM B-2647]